nr:hypothetical protein [Propionibacterium sp.]
MVCVEMLPAGHGDCLWIEYGDHPVRRILIDGGPAHAYPALRERILRLPSEDRHFELLVVTHIDADHIEGIIRLLGDSETLGCTFGRIWFNGRDQLNAIPDPTGQPLGSVEGEMLGVLIADYARRTGMDVWNVGFDGAVAFDREQAALPWVDLPGACRLTLLSPTLDALLELKYRWRTELKKAHVVSGDVAALRAKLAADRRLRPLGDVLGGVTGEESADEPENTALPDALGGDSGEARGDAPFGCDTSRAKGSSIALLLEYPADDPQVRLLLAGDAWPSVLEESLHRLRPDGRLAVDGFKVAHHASVANITEGLLAKLACRHYLISTSGACFEHPHARCVELLLAAHAGKGKPRLHFNYATPSTRPWADADDQAARGYLAFHPQGMALLL